MKQTKAKYSITWFYASACITSVQTWHYGTHAEAKAYAEANKGNAKHYKIRKCYTK